MDRRRAGESRGDMPADLPRVESIAIALEPVVELLDTAVEHTPASAPVTVRRCGVGKMGVSAAGGGAAGARGEAVREVYRAGWARRRGIGMGWRLPGIVERRGTITAATGRGRGGLCLW